jgi:NADH dehydrogenase
VDRYDAVVVGGGFGGAYAARALSRRLGPGAARVLVVSDQNFLLFAPVLPEAASGTLEPRHAVIPLREMLGACEVRTGRVEALDPPQRAVVVRGLDGVAAPVGYRYLVLAPGSIPATLDVPGLRRHAVGFKTLADAIWLRNRVLHQLEAAEAAARPEQRRQLLTFTFVGGGYAGVEGLAELQSLAAEAARRYRRVSAADMRWVLVEAAPSLLPGISPKLARYTEAQLRQRGVEIRLSTRLVSCEDTVVRLDDPGVEPYRSPTLVWTTGQRPHPLAARCGLPVDERGRVVVDRFLRVVGHPEIYAVGDAAAVPDRGGGRCPPTAQHALRQGVRAGRNLAADLGAGRAAPFRHRNRGLAVTLGQARGAAQVFGVNFRGFGAWWMGRSYHLAMMPGRARKARVVSDWTIGLLFPRDTAQIGGLGPPPPLPEPP